MKATRLRLISVSKGGTAALEAAAGDYAARIRRYTVFEEIVINPRGSKPPEEQVQLIASPLPPRPESVR